MHSNHVNFILKKLYKNTKIKSITLTLTPDSSPTRLGFARQFPLSNTARRDKTFSHVTSSHCVARRALFAAFVKNEIQFAATRCAAC